MRVFFSEPDGSTWMEEIPSPAGVREIQKAQVNVLEVSIYKKSKWLDWPDPPVKKRYKFAGISFFDGHGIMFYDRIEE